MNEQEDIVKLEFNEAKEKTFKIYFRDNATVQKDRRIGEYINHAGVKVPIISKFYGRIVKIDMEENCVVIQKCRHEIVFRSLCSSCGASVPKAQTYLSIHTDIAFSEEITKKEEENIVKRYIDKEKLILLLDIDNTILHASNFDLTREEYESLKAIYSWQMTIISIPIIGNPKLHQRIFIKFRPMLKELFEAIKDKYEIYIYTQGTKDYAEEIIKYLNEVLEYNYLSNQRLVARTGLTWENKSIKKIFPTTEDMVVILDDRMDVWSQNPQNLINLVPYYFFYDERSYKIKSRFRQDDDDFILFSIKEMLLFVNKSFYYHLHNFDSKTDIKLILEKKTKSILDGQKFTFSGLYTKDIDIYETRNGFLIEKMGGHLYEEYDEETDIVLTREYLSKNDIYLLNIDTSKIRHASKEGKLVLHEAWLEYCAFFFVPILEQNFILSKEHPKIEYEKLRLKNVFESNKENISDYYSCSEEQLSLFFSKKEIDNES